MQKTGGWATTASCVNTRNAIEAEESPELGHDSDPPPLVLASRADRLKHGHAMLEDIAAFAERACIRVCGETLSSKPQLEWVSVVVVLTGAGTVVFSVVVVEVTGAGTVVSAVVVVVLFVGSAFLSFTVVQAHSDKRAAAARHGMVRCFMDMMVVGVVTLQYEIALSTGQIIWGVTLIVEGRGNESTG